MLELEFGPVDQYRKWDLPLARPARENPAP